MAHGSSSHLPWRVWSLVLPRCRHGRHNSSQSFSKRAKIVTDNLTRETSPDLPRSSRAKQTRRKQRLLSPSPSPSPSSLCQIPSQNANHGLPALRGTFPGARFPIMSLSSRCFPSKKSADSASEENTNEAPGGFLPTSIPRAPRSWQIPQGNPFPQRGPSSTVLMLRFLCSRTLPLPSVLRPSPFLKLNNFHPQ
jgi:hypothetical protein